MATAEADSVDPSKRWQRVVSTWAAAQRWKAFRERRHGAYKKLSNARAARRRQCELTQRERVAHRGVPLELLAREWLNEQKASVETRVYLVDKLLPTLVVGLEKLLTEVSLRDLAETEEMQPDFNPVNFLAQHLMRNNPRYSNFAEAHPYCHTMREVSEELKQVAFSLDDSRLAQLKAQTKQRREVREREEAVRAQEEERRASALREVFGKWTIAGDIGVEVAQVQESVRSWLEVMGEHSLAPVLRDSFSQLLQDGSKTLTQQGFVTELMECGGEWPVDVFDLLTEHLGVCAGDWRRNKLKEQRRELFNEVFKACDLDKTGCVERLRVLHLFASYYDSAPPDTQSKLHNPRQWPVAELVETEEWEEGEEGSATSAALSEEEYQEFLQGVTGVQGGGEEIKPEAEGKPETREAEGEEGDKVAGPESKQEGGEGGGSAEPTAAGVGDTQAQEKTSEEKPPVPDQKEEEATGESLRPPPSSVLTRSSRTHSISLSRGLSGMSSRPVTPSGPGSSWDHCLLNRAQFVQLVELFLNGEAESSVVVSLASYLRENYSETEQERAERIGKAQLQEEAGVRRRRTNSLFDVWDNDCSGYLELEELQLVLSKWRGFSSEQAEEHAREILSSLGAQQKRLTRQQFHSYIAQLTKGTKMDEFEEFVDYLTSSVKLTFEELHRGERRQQGLARITQAGKTSGLQLTEALKTATAVVQQDGVEFGRGKQSSVCVALLEPSHSSPSPSPCLHFKAASPDCQASVIGRRLYQSCKQVSYLAVDSGRPVHVPNIQKHGGVFFFCLAHQTEEYNGSLVVVPIVTPWQQVVGVVTADTLTDSEGLETSFLSHEINFYQGVGVCLGAVYHWLDSLEKLLQVAQSALSWVHRRCPQLAQGAVYIVEPPSEEEEGEGYALRLMLVSTSENINSAQRVNEKLKRKDNLFRSYLFQCVDNSEPVSADAYGKHHLAFPLRDHTGCAVAVVDLCMPPTRSLHPQQSREVTRVLRLLTRAYHTLSRISEGSGESEGEESTHALSTTDDDIAVLFDQLMLADICESVARINNRMFAELRSYVDPPEAILHIIQALLHTLHPQQEFETWNQCKQYITLGLVKALKSYGPLREKEHPQLAQIRRLMEMVPTGSVVQHGSVPAKFIHSWVSVCLTLLEHSAAHAASSSAAALASESQSHPEGQ